MSLSKGILSDVITLVDNYGDDGFLTFFEFVNALAVMDDQYDDSDSDSDGDDQEGMFIMVWTMMLYAVSADEEITRKAFDEYDKEKKGKLNKEDLYAFVKPMPGSVITNPQIKEIIESIEADGLDEKMFSEFCKALFDMVATTAETDTESSENED